MNGWRYYWKTLRLLLKSQSVYRASFRMQVIAMIGMSLAELAAILILFERFPAMAGWRREDIFFFFGLMQMCFSLVELFGRGFSAFAGQVQGGGFDRILLKPRSTVLSVLCSQLDLRRIGGAGVGAAALAAGSILAGIAWTPAKGILLFLSVLGGCALLLGLFMIEAILSFRTIQSLEVVNILTYGGRSACQYPVDIYRPGFRWMFLYLIPYGLTMHVPAAFILGKPLLGMPVWIAFVSPLAGFVFLAAIVRLWHQGVRRYQSTGS